MVVENALAAFSAFMWGTPLVLLLVGGGLFFMAHSRLVPYRHFRHAFEILRGDYDDPALAGSLPHYQALATALSGTLGLGNVAGVAVAIAHGGPGAVFWMWVTAVVGVATKFHTATLAIMYRGLDSDGHLQGGPMYVVREGLGPRWRPLAYLFAVAGVIGTLPVFQVNQLLQLVRDTVAIPRGWTSPASHLGFDALAGVLIAAAVLGVILGQIRRIGAVAGRLVPFMVGLYLCMTAVVLAGAAGEIPAAFALILRDAMTGDAVAGGALGTVVLTGVRRGAFSNEAGIGTEALAHGAARTDEPVREGLVAMLGPVIDTLVVCTCTALVVIVTGVWNDPTLDGVTMSAVAFETAVPGGQYLLVVVVACLSGSTVLSMWYYGAKCLGFLVGAPAMRTYVWIYAALIVVGAMASLDAVLGLIDGMYAVMAIPTMTAAVLLAPKVRAATTDYFRRRATPA
jgi:AGCS family alanine or glycine:cation symporter